MAIRGGGVASREAAEVRGVGVDGDPVRPVAIPAPCATTSSSNQRSAPPTPRSPSPGTAGSWPRTTATSSWSARRTTS